MLTSIPVTNYLTVRALLPIENRQFAIWYSRGLFWAMYGDYQGQGPYEDSYLIDNVTRNIQYGWYHRLGSDHMVASGFYLGMLHGGCLDPTTRQLRAETSLVVITNADFVSGYESARRAPVSLTDTAFMRRLHSYALSQVPSQVLAHGLGEIVGSLSTAIIPMTTPVTVL